MDVEMSRTFAVNTLVVLEVFYLFSVRYLDAPSLTLRGILGTPAVLIAVGIVAGLQLMFTYAPFMQQFFYHLFAGSCPGRNDSGHRYCRFGNTRASVDG